MKKTIVVACKHLAVRWDLLLAKLHKRMENTNDGFLGPVLCDKCLLINIKDMANPNKITEMSEVLIRFENE